MTYQQDCAAMIRHTPGPWKLSHGGLPGDSGFSIVSGNAEARNVKVTAECWPCTIVSEEHRQELFANARLIAAAPELLEALTELLDFAIEANNRIPSPGTREELAAGFGCNPFMVAQFKKARAAIAKATAE